jgi:Helicase
MTAVTQDLARALDPVVLARAAGIEPDDWQADLLRSDDPQIILDNSRQSGKSTITGILAYHVAAFKPPALVLLASPSLRQSQELFRKVKNAHNALGADACPVSEESALRFEFMNGSRIVCLPGTEATVRSYSAPSLVVVDEASRVPDALYDALRPMLAVSRGRLVLLSTPWGKRGFFFREWTEGGAAWKRVRVPAPDCPRITAEWLAAEREAIGDWMFRQEYMCEFVEVDDAVFNTDLVRAAVNDDLEPFFGKDFRCSS